MPRDVKPPKRGDVGSQQRDSGQSPQQRDLLQRATLEQQAQRQIRQALGKDAEDLEPDITRAARDKHVNLHDIAPGITKLTDAGVKGEVAADVIDSHHD